MSADSMSVVQSWLDLTDDERARLPLSAVFGQVRLDVLDAIQEQAASRPGQFWRDVAKLAGIIWLVRTVAASWPLELDLSDDALALVTADRAHLAATGQLV